MDVDDSRGLYEGKNEGDFHATQKRQGQVTMMDENTLANFNNIHSEVMKVRLKGLINAINSNQGLYDSELVGNEVKAMQVDIQLRSQRWSAGVSRHQLSSQSNDS